jgi:single-strand DNA-binding protein
MEIEMQGDMEVRVTGRLTEDPALGTARSGRSWTSFTVVTNPRFRDKESGTWKDGESAFWKVVAFGDLADHICQSLSKGNRVTVTGTAEYEHYEDREGNKRKDVRIVAEDVATSLRFNDVKVVKFERASQQAPAAKQEDPWSVM